MRDPPAAQQLPVRLFRYASKKDWPALARDLRPVYTAPTEAAGRQRLADFADTWESRYPAIVQRGSFGGLRHLRNESPWVRG